MELMQASRQWASRPDDQRFTSLDSLVAHCQHQRQISRGLALSSRAIQAAPIAEDESRRSLVVLGPDGQPAAPTHWSFGQLSARIGAPAGYLRSLPSDIAADCINHGLFRRDTEDLGALLRKDGEVVPELAALTGPNYGRVWNDEVARALRDRFGDGITGDFTVPGEFGERVEVNKANTTLYASDRDMFVFLADEKNKIEVPGRRNGETGLMARGFFVWNSEVGSKTLGIATFLFDYVCANRIVWGAEGYQEITLRHTISAPNRFVEEVAPAIESYVHKSSASITDAIAAAKAKRIDKDAVENFLTQRFTRNQAKAISMAHMNEEGRPIENLWDATVGATAYARGIKHQDDRVAIEKSAGKIMAMGS